MLIWAGAPFIAISLLMEKLAPSFIPAELLSVTGPVLENLVEPLFMTYLYITIAGAALIIASYIIPKNLTENMKKKK